jgi:haloalkane dehalogenase
VSTAPSLSIDRTAYPFENLSVTIPAGRMHYVEQGRGEPVVFVHGTPTWSFEWRHLILGLAADYRCIAPDHIGFGLSQRPKNALYTPEAHAENFAAFIAAIDPPRFTLVVHDFGGPIALPFVIAHPERVSRLVIVNSWMWSFAGDREMEKKARLAGGPLGRLLYRYLNVSLRLLMPASYGDKRHLTPAIHRAYLDRFRDAWSRGAVLWPLAHSLLASSAHYDAIWRSREVLQQRPALIVWGMKDRAFPPRYLEKWREALPAAEVVELPDAGHWPHEEASAEVLEHLRAFLTHSDPSARPIVT